MLARAGHKDCFIARYDDIQLLAVPLDWASDYNGVLLRVHKTSEGNHPQHFELINRDAHATCMDSIEIIERRMRSHVDLTVLS